MHSGQATGVTASVRTTTKENTMKNTLFNLANVVLHVLVLNLPVVMG